MNYDDRLLKKLKAFFVTAHKNKFNEITEAIVSGEIARAHRLVHSLKSNAGMIGMRELQRAASDVEKALKDGVNHTTDELMSALQFALAATLDELAGEAA